MKKFAVYLFLLLSQSIFAQEDFDIKWNIGNLGIGLNNFQDDGDDTYDDYSAESFVDIFNIGIEHSRTRIGLEYSPIKYWNWTYWDTHGNKTEVESFSFLNFNLYWNLVDLDVFGDSGKFFFGPFNKINYAFVDNYTFRWNEFIYTAGLRTGLDVRIRENVNYHFLGGEIGYRNFNGRNTFYCALTIDILIFSIIFFSSVLYD